MADDGISIVFQALSQRGVRYIVVGGVAVVLHGHLRVTADLDLVVALDRQNALAAIDALNSIGFRPLAPVPSEAFADPSARQAWIVEKGMRVFSLSHPGPLRLTVDLFVEEPFPFDEAFERCVVVQIGGAEVPVASIGDLVALKRQAGRPQDIEDIRKLEEIACLSEPEGESGS